MKQLSLGNLCLFRLLNAYGQRDISYHVSMTSGINASQVTTPSLKNTTDLLGRYNVGIAVEQRFTPAIAVVYQLTYTRLGGSSTGNGLTGKSTSLTGLLSNITAFIH